MNDDEVYDKLREATLTLRAALPGFGLVVIAAKIASTEVYMYGARLDQGDTQRLLEDAVESLKTNPITPQPLS